MKNSIAERVLDAWGMKGAEFALVAQRENIVFKVTHKGLLYALRLHRPEYQSAQMIESELVWMQHLGSKGLIVPMPLPSKDGPILQKISGYYTDVLTWLSGRPIGTTGSPLELPNRKGTFRKIGHLMAQVHHISDDWNAPSWFERNHWDIEGLLGDTPVWDRFWENPGLDEKERNRICEARVRLWTDLSNADLDFGLIHADMLRENIIIGGDTLGLIDFDDSGLGFRLFDVATTLLKNRDEPDYNEIEFALIEGYRERRPLDTSLLPQFMLIRALSYLGWIITRIKEPGSTIRQERFLKSYRPLIDAYVLG